MASLHLQAAIPTSIAQANNSIAQARNIRELTAILPRTYRPFLGPVFEELYRLGQRAAQALSGLRLLQKHKDNGSLPSHLQNQKPTQLQAIKEYAGETALSDAQGRVDKLHKSYIASVLDEEISTRRGEYTLLISRASPLAFSERVTAICHSVDADLLADMYYVAEDSFPLEEFKPLPKKTDIDAVNIPTRPDPKEATGEPMEGVQVNAPPPGKAHTYTVEQRRKLLHNLELSGERIAAVAAVAYCSRAVALGRASTEETLATRMRKVNLRDEAKKAATAAGPSKPTTIPTNDPATDKRLSAIEKALKALASQKGPAGKKRSSSYMRDEQANQPCRKRRQTLREGPEILFPEGRKEGGKEVEGREPQDRQWWTEERLGEREGSGRDKEAEGLKTLRRCNYFVNGEDVPNAVLNVPFSSIVAYMREKMTTMECFIAPTPVFRSPGVHRIPEEVERIISFNLKFIPHCDPDPERFLRGFEEFKRSCRNRLFFYGKEKDPQLHPIILKKLYQATGWEVSEEDLHPGLERCLNKVEAYLKESLSASLHAYKRPKNPAFSAVKDWMTKSSCMVKMTDKNLGAAVISVEWYEENILKLLNTSTYRLVPDDEVTEHEHALTSRTDEIARLPRNKYIRKFLRWQPAPQFPNFHGIPKVHKNPWKLRPIVPCHSSWITNAERVLEAHIAMYLPRYEWIIDSTKAFIQRVEKAKLLSGRDIHFVTADVEQFYTNVDLRLAKRRLEAVMKGNPHIKGLLSVDETNRFMDFVNENTYFRYKDNFYQQVEGLAMGAPCSGAIANLFLGWEEKSWLKAYGDSHLRMYCRYIDDIALIYEGSQQELDHFLKTMTFTGLKLTFHTSSQRVVFLDTTLNKGDRPWEGIHTDLYAKPGNTHMYVPWSSAHPASVKSAFVKAEMIRRRLICSREQDFERSMAEFARRLQERGYPGPFIGAIEGEVRKIPRSLILAPSHGKDSNEEPLLLPSHYDKIWFDIKTSRVNSIFQEAVEEFLPGDNPFRGTQITKCMRRTKNLKDFVDAINSAMVSTAP